MSRATILQEISEERDQQIAKWGDQRLRNFRRGTFRDPEAPSVRTGTRRAMLGLAATTDEFRTRCELAEKSGVLSFADVLMEEVSEAMDAESAVDLRAELIQVAAVAVKWIESLDKQSAEDGRVVIHLHEGGFVVPPSFPKLTEESRVSLYRKIADALAKFNAPPHGDLVTTAAAAAQRNAAYDRWIEEVLKLARGPIDPIPSFAEQEARDLDRKMAAVPTEFRDIVVPHFYHSINSMLKHMGEPHPHSDQHRMYHLGQLASMIHYWKQFTVSVISATFWGAVWFPDGSFVAKLDGDKAIVARKVGGPLRLYAIKDGQLIPAGTK